MNLKEVAAAARGLADYIDKHGGASDLEVVAAQLRLAIDRLAFVQQARATDMADHLAEEKAIWGEL